MIVMTPPGPVPPTATPTPGAAGATTGAADFSALVAQALGDVSGQAAPTDAGATTAPSPDPEVRAVPLDTAGPHLPLRVDALPVGLLPGGVVPPGVAPRGPSSDGEDESPADEASADVVPDVVDHLVVPVPAVRPDVPAQAAEPPTTAVTAAVTTVPVRSVKPSAWTEAPQEAGPHQPAGRPGSMPAPGAAALPSPGTPTPDRTVPAPDPSVVASAAQVTGTSPATAITPTHGADTAASAVRAQVFPEVTRLVSSGTGTHRVTLQLNPGALGEVRVVLTVRRGVVRVSLAASPVAQRALADGAPELRRLLELGGASESRITVRDLSTGAPTGTTSTPDQGSTASGQSGSGQVRDESRQANHQNARTRDGSTAAMEGDVGQAIPPPIDPTTRTRTSGVDVTM